jgi:hypothetical protein
MSQIQELARKASRAPSPYEISGEQVRIFATLNDEEKQGAVLFETLSYSFSSGVIKVLASHIREVDFNTKLYIAKEITEESGHFTRTAAVCKSLGITPGPFFPDVGVLYSGQPNWLRFMAGCAFTLEQTAARVFGKFLSKGSRYFQPLQPFVADDIDHVSHSVLQLKAAFGLADEGQAARNRAIATSAITESLDHFAEPFFRYLTKVMLIGSPLTRRQIQDEWRTALAELGAGCADLGLEIDIDGYLVMAGSL